MFATNFLCSIYLSCFIFIDPLELGEGVRVGVHADWRGQSIEVVGENLICEEY